MKKRSILKAFERNSKRRMRIYTAGAIIREYQRRLAVLESDAERLQVKVDDLETKLRRDIKRIQKQEEKNVRKVEKLLPRRIRVE